MDISGPDALSIRTSQKTPLLEPRPTCLLVQAWKHRLSQDQWWELLGPLGQWFYSQCSDSRICWGSLLGHWSIKGPGQWYFEHEQLWQIIFLTLGLCYHKDSGGRGVRLQQRSSSPGWFWIQLTLAPQLLVILGTPAINPIINVIMESKIDKLSISLSGLGNIPLVGMPFNRSSPLWVKQL